MSQLFNKHTSIIGLSQLIKSVDIPKKALNQLLLSCGLNRDVFDNPDTTLSLQQEFALVRGLIQASENPQLGLTAGQCYRLNTFGPLGLAATSVGHFKHAIELFIQYLELTYTLFNVSFTTTAQWACVRLEENEPLGDLFTYYRDRDLSFAITAIRDIYPEAYSDTTKRLELSGPEPDDSIIYQDFFDCPVTFNQKHDCFWFDRKALELPLPQANELNFKMLEAQCEAELSNIVKPHNFSETITHEILALSDHHIPTQEEIAKKLSITPRTIRRKLSKEGLSFQQLLVDVLKHKSTNLIENSEVSIEEVGNQVGYSETAAFIRAFKRWTGKTPLQVRQTNISKSQKNADCI